MAPQILVDAGPGNDLVPYRTKPLPELEQLERLLSEIPPAAPWLPTLGIHINSQVKTRQSQSYKLKKNDKNLNFENLQNFTRDTSSEVA